MQQTIAFCFLCVTVQCLARVIETESICSELKNRLPEAPMPTNSMLVSVDVSTRFNIWVDVLRKNQTVSSLEFKNQSSLAFKDLESVLPVISMFDSIVVRFFNVTPLPNNKYFRYFVLSSTENEGTLGVFVLTLVGNQFVSMDFGTMSIVHMNFVFDKCSSPSQMESFATFNVVTVDTNSKFSPPVLKIFRSSIFATVLVPFK